MFIDVWKRKNMTRKKNERKVEREDVILKKIQTKTD